MTDVVLNISGDSPPFYVTMVPDEIGGEMVYEFDQEIIYSGLSSGLHTITVRDSKECIKTVEIMI